MVVFKAALINETEKLHKKKKVLIAIILSLIVIVFGQIGISALKSSFGLRTVGSMEFPILILSVISNSILPLFTALVTLDTFSGEFAQNTMKITLTRPITRLKLFSAKICAILIFVLTNLIIVLILSVIAGFLFNPNTFTIQAFIKIIVCYLVTLLPMFILSLIIVVFTNILKSGIGVFFLFILIFLVVKFLSIIFSQYSALFFTSSLTWYNLWLMDSFPFLKIFRQFMILLSYGILLFTGGYYLFDKKDF